MSFWDTVALVVPVCVFFGAGYILGNKGSIKVNIRFDFNFRSYLIDRNGNKIEQYESSEEEENQQNEENEENESEEEMTRMPEDTSNIRTLERDEQLEEMFMEEEIRNSKTDNQIQSKGIEVGAQPVSFPVAKNGSKYVSNTQLQEIGNTHRKFKKLSKRDEIDIISTFQNIIGMNYTSALTFCNRKGYKVYPIEVEHDNEVIKITEGLPVTYDATNLGVRIRDDKYDWLWKRPSLQATIIEIKNVGVIE